MIKIPLDLLDIFRIEYIRGYFPRNKRIFYLSLVVLLLFSCIGFINSEDIDVYGMETGKVGGVADSLLFDTTVNNNSNMAYKNLEQESVDDYGSLFEDYNIEGFTKLFMHNFMIDFSCILGGLLLSIPSLFFTYINGSIFGAIFADTPLLIILFGILPHGIFEIPSSIFALAGGLMLTKIELKFLKGLLKKSCTVKCELNDSIPLFKDSIISMGIVFILLFTAAFIETFITPLLLYIIIAI